MSRAGVLGLGLALTLVACGEGVIIFGGRVADDDENETVTVAGTVDDVRDSVGQPNAIRDIVVFVYSNLDPDDLANGPPFTVFTDVSDVETTVLAADKTFSLTDVGRGDLSVLFLLDGTEPDGRLDAGDECAALVDPEGDLRDIESKRRVDISDIDVFFSAACAGGDDGCPCGDALVDEEDIVVSTPADE